MGHLVNRKNYLLLEEFLSYEKTTLNLAEVSIKRHRSYLKHLLLWALDTHFSKANKLQPSFIKYLEERISHKTGEAFSRETWRKILGLTARFFNWVISNYPKGFKSFPQIWIDGLNIPKNITDSIDTNYVTYEEINTLANLKIPNRNLALLRDQAAAIMLFLSGMRAGALVTMPIEAVNLEDRSIKQWNKLGVKTKNNKSQTTYLFPIEDLLGVVQKWDQRVQKKLPGTHPWYAPIKNEWGKHTFSSKPPGKNRNQLLNKRLKILFKFANLPYKSAHKFRRGHLIYGLNFIKDISQYKALSQNLMHSTITITDQYYAKFTDRDLKGKILDIFQDIPENNPKLLDQIVGRLKDEFTIQPKNG